MNKKTFTGLITLLVVAAAAIYMFSSEKDVMPTEPLVSETMTVKEASVLEQEKESVVRQSEPAAGNAIDHIEQTGTENAADKALDVDAMLQTRAIGNPDAPITIQEFASLTCSHCAHFYNDTFPALKEKYIDTGKVYFIYEDFPLNAPALEASLVARCLPQSRYFKFIKFLFSTQPEWAYEGDYSSYLRQNAKLLGLNDAGYDACIQSEELREKFGDILAENQKKYEIRSTPTFIINGTETVSGAQPLQAFEQIFKKLGLNTDSEAESAQ